MTDNKNAQVDHETILMTLDQIGQTIDIMTGVVNRLRGYIHQQLEHHASSEIEPDDDAFAITHCDSSQNVH